MERAKRRVRICLICVVMLAVIVGIVYYYNEFGNESSKDEGTLVWTEDVGWNRLCQ